MLRLGRCTPFLLVFLGEINLSDVLIGTIKSPNFPRSYPPSVTCYWTVVEHIGNRIKVSFKTFHLGDCCSRKYNKLFDCDVLEVRDGALNTSNMIVTLCANQRPPVFYSSGDSLWIGFKSSSRPTNGSLGFEAIFSTENMVLASILPVIGCILLLCVIIAVPLIIKCRRQSSGALISSTCSYTSIDNTLFSRDETETLQMKTRRVSFSDQQQRLAL